MSKGENKIIDILNRARVRFEREKTYSDLKSEYVFYLVYPHTTGLFKGFQDSLHVSKIKSASQ